MIGLRKGEPQGSHCLIVGFHFISSVGQPVVVFHLISSVGQPVVGFHLMSSVGQPVVGFHLISSVGQPTVHCICKLLCVFHHIVVMCVIFL